MFNFFFIIHLIICNTFLNGFKWHTIDYHNCFYERIQNPIIER